MTSEAQKKDGWLLPEVLTGYPLKCVTLKIPDDPLYIEAFMGALHMLDSWYNWEKSYTPGDTRASQAAFYWRDLLMTYLYIGEDCEMPLDVRQNEETPCILEKTYNDGETWVQWANLRLCAPVLVNLGGGVIGVQLPDGTVVPTTGTPDDTYDGREYAPPPTPRGGSESSNKCLAAANAVNTLLALHGTVARLITVPDALSIAAAIAGLLISLLFIPIAVGIIVAIIAGGGVAIFAALTYGDFDSDVQHELQCILDCNATDTDGVVTFNFADVKAAVAANIAPLNIWSAIDKYLDIIGESGLNLAGATTAITDADCSDCGCSECAMEWDFLTSDAGWYAFLGRGSWSDGVGWQRNGGAPEYIQIGIALGTSVACTTVKVWFSENPTRAINLRAPDVDGSEIMINDTDPATPSPITFTVNTTISGLWLSLDSYPGTQGGAITRVCLQTS